MALHGLRQATTTQRHVTSTSTAFCKAPASPMRAHRVRRCSRQAVATMAPAAPSGIEKRHTYEGPVSEHPFYSDPLNLRNILDCGSHSSVDALDSVYTVGHGAVEGPARVYYENGAPLFYVLPGGNLAITEEVGRSQDAMERVTGRTLRGVDKVLGSVFKGAKQSRYLVTLLGDYTLPEGCRALKMPGHSCRAVFDIATLPEGQPLVLGPDAHLYMTVVMGQVPRCLTCPLFLSGSCGNR